MDLHLQQDWQRTLGQYVEVRRGGEIIRTGTVEDVMPDNSILWLSAAGPFARQMYERAEGYRVYARYPWDPPPLPEGAQTTQAERISERLGVVAISTGDIFRANVKGETPLGTEARNYMDAGDFVPDSVTNKMVRDRLSEADVENGFLLDGYPRTTAQLDYLNEILAMVTSSSTSCSS